MTVQERIEEAKRKLAAAEREKTVAETQLEAANKSLNEVVEKMKAYDVDPDTITGKITELTEKVDKELTEIEAAIPSV